MYSIGPYWSIHEVDPVLECRWVLLVVFIFVFICMLIYHFQKIQSEEYVSQGCWKNMFSFLFNTTESAVKSSQSHETSSVDPAVYFLPDKETTQTVKNPAIVPIVNIGKVYIFLLNFQMVFILWFTWFLSWFPFFILFDI
jgi:hypothetical protein